MFRRTFVLGVLSLLALPGATLNGQESRLSLAGICAKDSAVSRWTAQPSTSIVLHRSPLMAVVTERPRMFRYDLEQDSGGMVTPKGVRIFKSVGYGILAGGAGFGLGAGTAQLVAHPVGEDAGLAIIGGGLAGVPLLLPIGVHVGNESRGSLALDYLPVLGTGAGVLLIGSTAHDAAPFVALGAAHLAATVLIEHLVGD